MDYGFYFTGSLEAMTNVQLVGNNNTLCFLQESLSFSSYFLSLDTSFYVYSQTLFRLCLMEAIIVKSASIISNVVRAVDSGLIRND
jgi:hypothetical protein